MPQLLVQHPVDCCYRHGKDHTENTEQLSTNEQADNQNYRMQINLLSHELRHNKIGIQLIIYQIKKRYMKGSLRRLTVGNKYSRHSAHQRSYYRYRFGKDGPKAEHQRKVNAQKAVPIVITKPEIRLSLPIPRT